MKRIIRASKTLKNKLLSIDYTLFQDQAFVNYLKNYVKMYDVIIQRYVNLLVYIIKKRNSFEFSFMDYGGGTGIFSLLAKLAGVSKVTYLDLNHNYLVDFTTLAKTINVEVDNIILASHNSEFQEQFDVISNYDVLEHINKPLQAFINLKKILRKNGFILMESGANQYNPILMRINKMKHLKEEPCSLEAQYTKQRFEYIKSKHPEFPENLIKKMALFTRGFLFSQIDAFIDFYLIKGDFIRPKIKSNTCSPKTGIWHEHCFDFFKFAKELSHFFSDVKIICGKYPMSKPKFEKPVFNKSRSLTIVYLWLRFFSLLLSPIFNVVLKLLPLKLRVYLAPSYKIFVSK